MDENSGSRPDKSHSGTTLGDNVPERVDPMNIIFSKKRIFSISEITARFIWQVAVPLQRFSRTKPCS
jgi:hypothetical protein